MQLMRKFYDMAADLGSGSGGQGSTGQQLTPKDIENGLQLCSEPRPSDFSAMYEERHFGNQMAIKDAKNTVAKGPF